MELDNNQLIRKCLAGNPSAQKALYEAYKVPLFRVCLRYANDRAEAEDMLQDGFIKIFQDLKNYRGTGAFGGWMRKLMVNVALQHLRKKKRLFPPIDLQEVHEQFQTDEDIHAEINAKALTQLVQQLPPGYRAVFNLYVIEGYSHKEIAEQLGITLSTSKSQLFKAKATLRGILEKMIIN